MNRSSTFIMIIILIMVAGVFSSGCVRYREDSYFYYGFESTLIVINSGLAFEEFHEWCLENSNFSIGNDVVNGNGYRELEICINKTKPANADFIYDKYDYPEDVLKEFEKNLIDNFENTFHFSEPVNEDIENKLVLEYKLYRHTMGKNSKEECLESYSDAIFLDRGVANNTMEFMIEQLKSFLDNEIEIEPYEIKMRLDHNSGSLLLWPFE